MKKKLLIIVTLVAAALLPVIIYYSVKNSNESNNGSVVSNVEQSENSIAEDKKSLIEELPTVGQQLSYLIEEEKLAHDIYTKLFEKYGARVFGNILESENTHQSRVLVLLDERGIADPRVNEIGKFNNQELQNLYNQLLAKALLSEKDAYEVGVIIEEKDIDDISSQLSTATDQDIISALESLRSGSENHLRAYNRQLGK